VRQQTTMRHAIRGANLGARRPVARVVLSLGTGGRNEFGLDNYLVVHGPARVEPGGAPELLQRLAHVYLGPDVKFPPIDDPPLGFIMRITPERLAGVGPWR
jgi:hypothetical protein